MRNETINYSPFDTVRLTRQIARELGAEEPIKVLCVESDNAQFERITKMLGQIGPYQINRVFDVESARQELHRRDTEFCIFSASCAVSEDEIIALCRDSKTPTLIFRDDNVKIDHPSREDGIIQYFNGTLHNVPISWASVGTAIRQTLHRCYAAA